MGNITEVERKRRQRKFDDEPQVHLHFPYHEFKTKEEWIREVEKKWIPFRESFKNSEIGMGAYYYPIKVANWVSQIYEMDKLMQDFCAGISNEPTGTCIQPLSRYEELRKK